MLPIHKEQLAMPNSGIYYGIDLGTTFTVIARIDLSDKDPLKSELPIKLLTIEQFSPMEMDGSDKSDMVASVLGVNLDGKMFVGNKLYRLKGHPDFEKDRNLFYHWKLDLGISVKPMYKDAVKADLDDASKIAGKILNYCRIQAIGKEKEWENVIVTVPASFQANQRNDVLNAIAYANIKQAPNMLIDEPNAAFIGYLNQLCAEEKLKMLHTGSKNVLVVDFGGGTCDLSVLRLNTPDNLELRISNLAISRYNDLGGSDLDLIIAEKYLLPIFTKQVTQDDFTPEELEKQIIPQLAVIAEKLKIDLSRTISSRYQDIEQLPEKGGELSSTLVNQLIRLNNLDYTIPSLSIASVQLQAVISYIFTEIEYKLEVVDKVIHSVPAVIDDILKKSNLAKTDIDYVLFVGGSVQNLLFVKETSNLFPTAQMLLPRRPDVLVAHGAAIYSFYRNALGVELLKPICSDSIGVTLQNAAFFPLIEAGTTLPAEVHLPSFRVQSMSQRKVAIPFCIGNESKVVKILNLTLPSLTLTDSEIVIKACLSVDKILTAEVRIDDTVLGEVTLNNPFVLANVSEEERALAETLENLKMAQENKDRNSERNILRTLIWEYYNLGNHPRAAALGEEWLQKFSTTDSDVHNLIHCSYKALGQRRKATEFLDKGLKYSPENKTLHYNKSLMIEQDKGVKEATSYLIALSPDLQQSTSIRFRIALLKMAQKEDELAKTIVAEYNNGGFQYINSFDRALLMQILRKFNIETPKEANKEANKKTSFSDDNLLRVKGDLPAVK